VRRGTVYVWLRDIAIALVASVFIITVLYQPVRVEGISMQPGLRDQDRLFIEKFFFRYENINRGDVIVFHYPRDPEQSYIKRVIGLPGDTIVIHQGRVLVNNLPIDEPYVPRRFRDTVSMGELVVPPGQYFVMGDHRSISSDSRAFGPVERSYIYGKAEFIYWPADNMGVVH
jgi:signal peptidase I